MSDARLTCRGLLTLRFACKRNPDVTFDVLMHKAMGMNKTRHFRMLQDLQLAKLRQVDGAKFYTDGRVFEQSQVWLPKS